MLIEIEKHMKDFDAIYFCAIALSINKQDKRGYLRNIKADSGLIIGTNGKRLHIAECGLLEDGYYFAAKVTKSLIWLVKNNDADIKYPDFSFFKNLVCADEWYNLGAGSVDTLYPFVSSIMRGIPNNKSVNYNYIEDALQNDVFFAYVHKKGDPEDEPPIVLQAGTKRAFLMPVT